jgi:hypothetical protein
MPSSCAFSLHFDATAADLFAAARSSILEQGGTFVGSPQQGKASLPTDAGTVYWTFVVQGQNLKIQVTDKPWLVSCSDIQQQMAELVASAPKAIIDTVGAPVFSPTAPTPPPAATPYEAPAPAPPPFKVTTPPYGLWFIGGTLVLLSMFWMSRRFVR